MTEGAPYCRAHVFAEQDPIALELAEYGVSCFYYCLGDMCFFYFSSPCSHSHFCHTFSTSFLHFSSSSLLDRKLKDVERQHADNTDANNADNADTDNADESMSIAHSELAEMLDAADTLAGAIVNSVCWYSYVFRYVYLCLISSMIPVYCLEESSRLENAH